MRFLWRFAYASSIHTTARFTGSQLVAKNDAKSSTSHKIGGGLYVFSSWLLLSFDCEEVLMDVVGCLLVVCWLFVGCLLVV